MTPRIYTAAEARALREAAPAGPYEAWHPDDMPGRSVVVGGSERRPPYDHFVVGIEDRVRVPLAELFAASPDLAATVEAQADEIARLRERVVISDARLECAHDDNDRLRRERDEARDEVERAEPRRQRDARDIADADAEIARLRAGLEVAQTSLAAAASGRRVTVVDEIERLQRERDALRDAAREYLDAEDAIGAAWDSLTAEVDDATWVRVNEEIGAADIRRDAARTRLAALVGGAR